jgi:hypothetical protein
MHQRQFLDRRRGGAAIEFPLKQKAIEPPRRQRPYLGMETSEPQAERSD